MFIFGGGKSMGGGGGGGGGMIRTVGRAVTRAGGVGTTTNIQDPISSSSSTTSPTTRSTTRNKINSPSSSSSSHLSLSASSSSLSSPFSPHPGGGVVSNWPSFGGCDEYEWVSVDDVREDDKPYNGFFIDEFALGPVPSLDEVNSAVSALQQVFDPASYSQRVRDKFASNVDKDVADRISSPHGLIHHVPSFGSELDWMEPALHPSSSRMLHSYGSDRVYDAFNLLSEPSVQKMVISLSSDEAVWNAVLNNEVVRELKETFYADAAAAESNGSEISDASSDDSNPAINIIKWIFDNTKSKFMEVIEKITSIVNELLKPSDEVTTGAATAEPTDPFDQKLRTSFLLSVVVLLVVVVTRAGRA